jgi:putative N6-adenine-specific DNA methylase
MNRTPVIRGGNDFSMVAKTMFGLEETLAGELLKLGARDIELLNRAVRFTGDKGTLYKCNLSLRTALRILVPVTSFQVSNEESLYRGIRQLPWNEYLDASGSLAIDTVLQTDLFNHSQFISQKAKDGIADYFRDVAGRRPDVDLDNPDLRVNLHIVDNTCNVSFDSSGSSLHKRGYRDQTNLAPLNEVLAAGLVLLSGWDGKRPLVDPMCGSGTILIEAAMYAAGIPPGYYRQEYGFMKWKHFLAFDVALYNNIYESAISRIRQDTVTIVGGELSPHVTRKARENVKLARVEDMVEIRHCDLADFIPPPGPGTAIMNPPYGERMNKDDISELYGRMGDAFKKNFTGYDCWILTANMEGLKQVGLRPSRKIKLFNGPLECRFARYEMYQGSRKPKHPDPAQ